MSIETEPNPNRYVRKYVEKRAVRWEHQGIAAELYRWSDVFRFYWFRPQNGQQAEIPNLVVGIGPMRIDVLAGYHLKENTVGLPYEITFNQLYITRPIWETLETMVHELIHLYQENTPGMMPCRHNYHNAQFVQIATEIGLHPRLGTGAHGRPADGQFARLMDRYGVERPLHAVDVPPETPKKYWWDDDRGRGKGSSTLVLYTSESCTRKPVCKLRSGRSDLKIRCETCDGAFIAQK